MTRFLLLPTAFVAMTACEPVEDDNPATPRPEATYGWTDNADPNGDLQEGTFTDSQSCGISVQSPTEGQYFLDFRSFDDDALLRMSFPDAIDEPPANGTYVVSVDVMLDFSLPSPLGVMDGTSGGVLVREQNGWRTFTITAVVDNGGGEGGSIEAELACPL